MVRHSDWTLLILIENGYLESENDINIKSALIKSKEINRKKSEGIFTNLIHYYFYIKWNGIQNSIRITTALNNQWYFL